MQQSEADFQTPLIFDDSLDFSDYPSAHRFADEYPDGLLARSAALLSMSGYEKSQPLDLIRKFTYHTLLLLRGVSQPHPCG